MKAKWAIGVDFGGTNIRVGLVSASGRVPAVERFPATGLAGPSSFVKALARAIDVLTQSAGVRPRDLRGVCVGVPGPVDAERGIVRLLVNVPGWREVPLRRLLERALRCRCEVDNDVNVVALGEWRFGAGRLARQLVCLTLGTGVGGGLVLDGALYRGSDGSAGEIGHIAVNPLGPRCGCGSRGCLEAYVGTAAILRMGRRALRRGAEPLGSLVQRAHGRLTPALISAASRRGDADARRIWADIGRWLGIGLASIVNLLNPDRIVIGGGVAGAWPSFSPTLMRTLRARALTVSAQAVQVVSARLGDRAGIMGAAVLLWDKSRSTG